ncbi:hypothetical protein BC834DRAFT_862759 [Gloeopeniophorella convolvens]|nr:hypothetical protein BC834DRAFT_862759 [Gloeopeniophorella convolvens]
MRKAPYKIKNKDRSRNKDQRQPPPPAHYGPLNPSQLSSPLLSLPSESLLHITSFLDPKSLEALAQIDRRLWELMRDDNTWRRAFVCQYLGIGPESPLDDVKALTLRLSGGTWRNELTRRYASRESWSRSRNTAISYQPLPTSISAIYSMNDEALLSASFSLGIVSRSNPLTGKVLKGFLSPNGPLPTNPVAALVSSISICVLASDGLTAKIIWGRHNGSVSVMIHPKTMSGTQSTARILDHPEGQGHSAAILDGTWASDGHGLVTAGVDGRVKIWSVMGTRALHCVWTSEPHQPEYVFDSVPRVVEDLTNGLVVAATGSGDVIVFSGFKYPFFALDTPDLYPIQKIRIPAQLFPQPGEQSSGTSRRTQILNLSFCVSSPSKLSILVAYRNSVHFYRCDVDLPTGQANIQTYGTAGLGVIRCIQPDFSTNPSESSFIVVGTQLGIVGVYDWGSGTLSNDPLPATRHVDVFEDAHVTNVAVNPFVIVAGSSRGAIRVLDVLTLEPLRSLPAPTSSDVRQIELRGDALLASIGSKVLAWRGGNFGSSHNPKTRNKGKQAANSGPWSKQYEVKEAEQDIEDERKRLKKEAQYLNHSIGREHEQLKKLNSLGLSEREAVEYTLMLSRDEELKRRQLAGESSHEEGVFDIDESIEGHSDAHRSSPPSSPSLSPSHGHYSPRHSPRYSPPSPPVRQSASLITTAKQGQEYAKVSPSKSNAKVQVSPRFFPEPKEAGGLSGSPQNMKSGSGKGKVTSSPRSSSYLKTVQTPASATPPKVTKTSSSGDLGAWNKPLPTAAPFMSPSASSARRSPPLTSSSRTDWGSEAERIRQAEDLELRFALELSLAEAQSREENA